MNPRIIQWHLPKLMKTAKLLPSKGKLAISSNNLIYLDIDDEFIHKVFPLLPNEGINKPNYFGKNSAGAHISVIYPEENREIDNTELGKEHAFLVKDFITAEIGNKLYYIIMIESPTLLNLRNKLGLSDLLNFKGYLIGFHITVGVV